MTASPKKKPRRDNAEASHNVVTFHPKEINHMNNATGAAVAVQHTNEPVTDAATFSEIPAAKANLFSITAGIPARFAFSHANCLVDGLIKMASDGIDDGIDSSSAFLMRSTLESISGLLDSISECVY